MIINVMEKLKVLPGPRYKGQGKGSGEEFRDKFLIPAFDNAVNQDEELTVIMDGATYGYPTSFLEEAFGGLARRRDAELAMKYLKIQCVAEPALADEVMHYIQFSKEHKTHPFEMTEQNL